MGKYSTIIGVYATIDVKINFLFLKEFSMQKKVDNTTYKTPTQKTALERGIRVKFARNLSNLTRQDMWERYQIKANTIHAWEKGTNCLTEKNADKLCKAFQDAGFTGISTEWLLYGETQTQNQDKTHLKKHTQDLTDIMNMREDLKIFDEINYFRSIHSNAVSVIVSDNGLEPLFCVGDHVAGICLEKEALQDLLGQFCIIKTYDGQILVRKLINYQEKDRFTIGSINPMASLTGPHYFSCDIQSAAQITRHWRLGNIIG